RLIVVGDVYALFYCTVGQGPVGGAEREREPPGSVVSCGVSCQLGTKHRDTLHVVGPTVLVRGPDDPWDRNQSALVHCVLSSALTYTVSRLGESTNVLP